jgi:hypothetical protein
MRGLMIGAAALAVLGAPVAAQAPAARSVAAAPSALAQFTPQDEDAGAPTIDFTIWDTALHWFVLNMGRSLREFSSRPQESTGSRLIQGHDSPYRLEGNRVAFDMMPEDVKQSLTDYRRDLEQLPEAVELTKLGRNEQLAYWINLHNVAVIEQLALAYPVKSPTEVNIAGVPLDDAPIITVSGVRLSPKDIRTKIVYPNWRDAKVMYGFWRGDIGGPTISRDAYSGSNVAEVLEQSAREFVNSLRGAERRGDTMHVSAYYLEAQPFYFPNWNADLRQHLRTYSNPDVMAALDQTSEIKAGIEEIDIADLSKGEREAMYSNLVVNGNSPGIRVNPAVARLMNERQQKLEKIWKENGRQGRVIFQDAGEADKPVETVK